MHKYTKYLLLDCSLELLAVLSFCSIWFFLEARQSFGIWRWWVLKSGYADNTLGRNTSCCHLESTVQPSSTKWPFFSASKTPAGGRSARQQKKNGDFCRSVCLSALCSTLQLLRDFVRCALCKMTSPQNCWLSSKLMLCNFSSCNKSLFFFHVKWNFDGKKFLPTKPAPITSFYLKFIIPWSVSKNMT